MKVAERTVSAIAGVVTGDATADGEGVAPYNSGPKLVRFFNELGANDVYGSGFPSRSSYAEQKVRNLNGTSALAKAIESILDPRAFVHTDLDIGAAVAYLNQYLRYDGYKVIPSGDFFKVVDARGARVEFEQRAKRTADIDATFINEQSSKSEAKLRAGDFDGAITNARSLVEAVLIEIERKLSADAPRYNGDLMRLYKRVQRLLNLDPARSDIADSLRQVLSGFVSIISGLGALRNKMSDAHASTYRPARHHAKLATNAAKTLADFMFETFEYQLQERKVTLAAES